MKLHQIVTSSASPAASPRRPIDGWELFLQDGEGYLRTAVAAHRRRRQVFTADILYNLAAMALEKFFMAALMRHGTMPDNHTMIDMVTAMEATFPDAVAEIREALIALDRYQQICDPYEFSIEAPAADEIPAMLELTQTVHRLVTEDLLAGVV